MSRTVFAWSAFQLSNSFCREFLAPHIVRIKVPGGFPYESFNCEGNISPWKCLSFVESSRSFGFNGNIRDANRGFLDLNVLYQNILAFIASCSLKISPNLYNKDLPKSPLIITKKLIYVGNTSANILTEVSHPEIDKPFIECKVQTVCVDKNTRKPVQFPDWWKQKYQQYSQKNEVLNWRLSESCPMEYISYPLIIQPSDCDAYYHVNWSNYLKFCCDALIGSNIKSQTDNSELKQPHVKSAFVTYIKESNAGEELTVNFWIAKENKEQISFEVLDKKKVVVCQAQIELQTTI